MIRNSATSPIVAARCDGDHRPSFSARRNSSRGMLAASAYSWARREEARGRGRLLHPGDEQAGGDQGVDVAGQRAVDERDPHVLVHLLQRRVLDQVGPDPPVLLVEDAVVDPAAARRLQQRVVEEEEEPAARAAAPGPPRRWPRRRRRCARRRGRRRPRRSWRRRKGSAGGLGPGVARPPPPRARATASWAPGRVDADHPLDARQAGGQPGDLALAAARRRGPGRPRPGASAASGRICSVVLGVGPVGEASLPPGGVDLPEARRLLGDPVPGPPASLSLRAVASGPGPAGSSAPSAAGPAGAWIRS